MSARSAAASVAALRTHLPPWPRDTPVHRRACTRAAPAGTPLRSTYTRPADPCCTAPACSLPPLHARAAPRSPKLARNASNEGISALCTSASWKASRSRARRDAVGASGGPASIAALPAPGSHSRVLERWHAASEQQERASERGRGAAWCRGSVRRASTAAACALACQRTARTLSMWRSPSAGVFELGSLN